MSFYFEPPKAPLLLDGPNAEQVARSTQARRCLALAKLRTLRHNATWRDVLLGTRREQQDRLVDAMRRANFPVDVVERVHNCSNHAYLYEHQLTGELRIRHFTCHNRFCLLCQRQYLRRVREIALSSTPEALRRHSFLTLTQRAQAGRGLRETLGIMLRSFRRLRCLAEWKARVPGGLYVVEITRGTKSWWHVHIHAIIDSGFWPLDTLRKAWMKATRDEGFCHISAIVGQSEERSRRYLTKYLSKPFCDELYQHPEALADFVAATRGRQLIQAFGIWRKHAIVRNAHKEARLPSADPADWRIVGEMHDLIESAERGSLSAARYLRKLGFEAIQLRHDAQSEVERFQETRAKTARPPPLFSSHAA